jgi:N-acetylneuraminate synthase
MYMKIRLTPRKEIFNGCEPYVIAEIGSNHNGDMNLARQLIQVAKDAGADCAKFQSWSKKSIFSRSVYENNYFLKDDYRNRTDTTLEEIVEKFSISESDLHEMKRFCDEIGIDCISTPFSKREVDFLVEGMNVPFIKIASMDVNNYPFLQYVAGKGLPIVISTGLSELYEIDKAIRTIERAGNLEIVILHCVSNYPPKDEEVNLNNIRTLQTLYPYPVGFSDHTLGVSIPLASVALGACLIEKHFTLDKTLSGWDHKVSATPDEMKIICNESKKITRALGSQYLVCEEGQERKNAFRRSIVVTRDIDAGQVIGEEDIDFKRPGDGISPEYTDFVRGRIARHDLKRDQVIRKDDLV